MIPLQSPKSSSSGPPPIPSFDLAAALANPPADGLIQLPSGVFPIVCDGIANRCRKSGVTVRGTGYQRTRIVNINPANQVGNQPVLCFDGDDCTVEDVTLDAGAGDGEQYSRSCLTMNGHNPTIRGVRGIRASGFRDLMATPPNPGVECFSFFLTGQGNGLISQCRLEQVKGNYVEGFCVRGSVKVRDCHVEYPILDSADESRWFGGYQAAYSSGASFIGCSQVGGQAFLYTDTGSDSNLLISDCFGTELMRGVIIVRGPDTYIDGLNVHDCVFELSVNADASKGSNGIAVSGSTSDAGTKRNCRFTNNLIRFVGGAAPANPGAPVSIGVCDGVREGTVIIGNSYDPAMTEPIAEPSCQMVHANAASARAVPAPSPT